MATHLMLSRVLCIGVDVTWWGGGSRPTSRWETIVSATLDDRVLHPIQRISLTDYLNPRRRQPTEPNFDADGKVLCNAILHTITLYPNIDRVIIALDAPLICRKRPGQPTRRKAVGRGEKMGTLLRESERMLREGLRARRPRDPAWDQDLRIQAGSPIPSRIARIVDKLSATQTSDLRPYCGGDHSPRGVVEVFPSEAISVLGLLGAYGDLDSAAVRAYKARQPARLTFDEARAVARRPLEGFLAPLSAGGLPVETVNAWLDQIAGKAVELATIGGEVRKSKSFDDPIDSGIAFLTAVACALGQFHVWDAGLDGTIVGPGRL